MFVEMRLAMSLQALARFASLPPPVTLRRAKDLHRRLPAAIDSFSCPHESHGRNVFSCPVIWTLHDRLLLGNMSRFCQVLLIIRIDCWKSNQGPFFFGTISAQKVICVPVCATKMNLGHPDTRSHFFLRGGSQRLADLLFLPRDRIC